MILLRCVIIYEGWGLGCLVIQGQGALLVRPSHCASFLVWVKVECLLHCSQLQYSDGARSSAAVTGFTFSCSWAMEWLPITDGGDLGTVVGVGAKNHAVSVAQKAVHHTICDTTRYTFRQALATWKMHSSTKCSNIRRNSKYFP